MREDLMFTGKPIVEHRYIPKNRYIHDETNGTLYVPCVYRFLFSISPFDFAADKCIEIAKNRVLNFIEGL